MSDRSKDPSFPTTQWTLISRIRSRDASVAARALDEICAQYHYPLYCYIRRRGLDHHDAQDALHDFLAKLLRLETFENAHAEKGRLRSLLAAALGRFLINWHRDHARRDREVSTDSEAALTEAETRYLREHFTDADTPERVFERKWAQELMQHVLSRLNLRFESNGRGELFRALRPTLLRGGSLRDEDADAIASSLGMKTTALRVANSRLLRDYRKLFEEEVRQTVDLDEEVPAEIASLRSLFGAR